jgi:hypothetical protein
METAKASAVSGTLWCWLLGGFISALSFFINESPICHVAHTTVEE